MAVKNLSQALKENKKRTFYTRVAIIASLIVLITLFTFIDFQASKAFYGYDKIAGKIFSYTFFVVGYVPAIIVDTVLFAVCFCKVNKMPLKVLFAFLVYSTLFGAMYTVFESFPEAKSAIKYGICGGFATLAVAPVLLFFKRQKAETLDKLFYIFLLGALMALIAVIIVAGLQYTWGRNRFFEVIGAQGLEYGAWYKPTGNTSSHEFRSFPSMHTSSAASFCMLMLIGWQFDLKKRTRIILSIVAIVLMACVPLSRIVMGRHYFTDVLFALLFSYIAAELALFIGDKLYLKFSTKSIKTQE